MIYAIGDSFTFGDELESQDQAWPQVLATMLDKEVINQGRPATGNTRIVKRALDAVINSAEMIIIGWSETNRQEFADEIGIYDIWAGRSNRAMQQDLTHRREMIKYLTAYDTPEYYYADWLRKIILVQTLCKFHDIPCVMFVACGANVRHQEHHTNFKKLVDQIDQSMFVDGMVNSVAEWCYGTPRGPNGHPLAAGHKIIAEKINEHIRHISRT